MMQSTIKLLLPLLFFAWVGQNAILAQDPHFSQFFANRVYLNPAYAGFDAGSTISLNYRDQWFGVPDASNGPLSGGFRSFNATFNQQIPCIAGKEGANFGFALSAFHDAAGSAPLITTGFGLALSHEQTLKGERNRSEWLKRLDLRIGAQLSYMQKRLESQELIYSFQLDPVVGLLGDASQLDLRSNLYSNMNAGIMIRGLFGKNKRSETLFTLGFSLSNINEPGISLHQTANKVTLPRRITYHAGTTHRISSYKGVSLPWYLSPQFRWDRQFDGRLNLHTVGAYAFSKAFYGGFFVQYNFPKDPVTNSGLTGTIFARNTTTLILNIGMDVRTFLDNGHRWDRRASGVVVGFSYDVPLNGVGSETTLGVLELNLRVNFGGDQKARCGGIGKNELYDGECVKF